MSDVVRLFFPPKVLKGYILKNEGGGENIKFVKKGGLAKSEANELLLVDENKNAYKVDQTIIAIWNMCDGNKTQEQIVDDLAGKTNIEKNEIKEAVSDILTQLEQAGLVQKV